MASAPVRPSKFPHGLPLMIDYKLSVNKPFLPGIALGEGVHHSSRKQTNPGENLPVAFEQTSVSASLSLPGDT